MKYYRGITDSRFTSLLHAEKDHLFRRMIYERDGGICALCGTPVDFDRMHLDHRQPEVLGGSNNAENMQVTHPACNIRKCGKDPSSFNGACAYNNGVDIADLIDIPAAADLLQLKTITVYQAIKRGHIRILTHIEGRKMLSRADVVAYKARTRVYYPRRPTTPTTTDGASGARRQRRRAGREGGGGAE